MNGGRKGRSMTDAGEAFPALLIANDNPIC